MSLLPTLIGDPHRPRAGRVGRVRSGGGEGPRGGGHLVAPGLDAWLVGGVGIFAWVLVARPGGIISAEVPVITGTVMWLMLAITGTHFGISYHLAYGQGRGVVRRRWLSLIAVPAALGVGSIAVVVVAAMGAREGAELAIRALLVAVFTLTGWHYVKQVYGVARIGAALHDLPVDSRSGTVLRYGLYPLWFLNASAVWTQGYRPAQYGFDGGFAILPPVTERLLEVVAVLSLLVVGAGMGRLAWRWRRLPPATMWTPYVAGFLWFIWTPGHVSTFLVLGALHGLQYLVCAHRAELSWAAERGGSSPAVWWASAFGGALATGMLLSYWIPTWLSDAAGVHLGPVVAVLLFAVFNLHHYAIDAVIWRAGGGHVRRIVSGPARPAA